MSRLFQMTFCLMLFVLCISASGCAVMEGDNRRTLNVLDETVQIESVPGRVAAAPVFIPVGLTALSLDMAVVHPATALPKALDDTYEVVWENPNGSGFSQALLIIPKIVGTPVIFSFDWIGRCLLPID